MSNEAIHRLEEEMNELKKKHDEDMNLIHNKLHNKLALLSVIIVRI